MGAGFQSRGTASRAHGARACAYAVSAGSSAPHAPPGCLQSACTNQRAGPPQGPQSQPRLFQAQDGPTQERLTLQGSVSQLWHRRAGRMAVEKGTLLNSRKSLTALSAFWHT